MLQAVKNTKEKVYTVSQETVCNILRQAIFAKSLDADFIEEAIVSDGIEFRFARKTTMARYGRNYTVKVINKDADHCCVATTVQSHKKTMCVAEVGWEKYADKVFSSIDIMLAK